MATDHPSPFFWYKDRINVFPTLHSAFCILHLRRHTAYYDYDSEHEDKRNLHCAGSFTSRSPKRRCCTKWWRRKMVLGGTASESSADGGFGMDAEGFSVQTRKIGSLH